MPPPAFLVDFFAPTSLRLHLLQYLVLFIAVHAMYDRLPDPRRYPGQAADDDDVPAAVAISNQSDVPVADIPEEDVLAPDESDYDYETFVVSEPPDEAPSPAVPLVAEDKAEEKKEEEVYFSAFRAREHLEHLTDLGPRVVGSPENEVAAVAVIISALDAIKTQSKWPVEVDTQVADGSFFLKCVPDAAAESMGLPIDSSAGTAIV
jgi:hypothetical protein